MPRRVIGKHPQNKIAMPRRAAWVLFSKKATPYVLDVAWIVVLVFV